jgi:exopolyphosphatase/guanosine-5'-triphosphate,3'-diphosphate pyrophosphatase
VLRRFHELAGAQRSARVIAVGTGALRDAENRANVITAAGGDTGVDVIVIPGGKEECVALLGVRTGLPEAPARLLMMDIGGGSTELRLAEGEAIFPALTTSDAGLREAILLDAFRHGLAASRTGDRRSNSGANA